MTSVTNRTAADLYYLVLIAEQKPQEQYDDQVKQVESMCNPCK